jgi:Tfp pilus assembly protein PilF
MRYMRIKYALIFCGMLWVMFIVNEPLCAAMSSPVPVRQADAVCERCHEEIFRKYLATPMANASGVALDRAIPGGLNHLPSGMKYNIFSKDGSLWLSYDRAGNPPLNGSHKLDYFLGSGHLGVTYLYSVNGYLLESPVAYYANRNEYDMKPGLTNLQAMPPALPITSGCLRCHMSSLQREDLGSRNRYQALPFLHSGITCERCHGDASQHVATNGRATIINPIKLDPERRDSVCINCHLEGDTNVEHHGRSVLDYKPGDRISDFISYFVYASANAGDRGVSEIEELSLSKCKRISGDAMSCMSCHDPHYAPPKDERADFYRSKCLACHSQSKFATEHYPSNSDCVGCHMPAGKAENIPHVAWTDHRIRQRPDQSYLANTPSTNGELVSFLQNNPSTRDLALAYYNLGVSGNAAARNKIQRLLHSALQTSPEDPALLSSLGYLAQLDGETTHATELTQSALKIAPNNVEATNNLAMLLAKSGQLATATSLWKMAFDLNEDNEQLGINLALAECMLNKQDAAKQVLERVLVYSPDSQVAQRRLKTMQSDQATCSGQ